MLKKKKNKNFVMSFKDYLEGRHNRVRAEKSVMLESNKLRKVLNIFTDAGGHDLDDISAFESGKALAKLKNKLLNNPAKKKKKIANIIAKKPKIGTVVLAVKEKGDICKETTAEKIYKSPWIIKLASVSIASLMLSVSICRFSPQLCYTIADKTDRLLYSKTLNFYTCADVGGSEAADKETLSRYIINNSDNLKNLGRNNRTLLITKEELFGQAAAAAPADANNSAGNEENFLKRYVDKLLGFLGDNLEYIFEKQEQASLNMNEKLINYLEKQNLGGD